MAVASGDHQVADLANQPQENIPVEICQDEIEARLWDRADFPLNGRDEQVHPVQQDSCPGRPGCIRARVQRDHRPGAQPCRSHGQDAGARAKVKHAGRRKNPQGFKFFKTAAGGFVLPGAEGAAGCKNDGQPVIKTDAIMAAQNHKSIPDRKDHFSSPALAPGLSAVALSAV